MKEIKFSCPACGQHVTASEEWAGRMVDCPSCKKPITIPPPKTANKSTPDTPSESGPGAKTPSAPIAAGSPAKTVTRVIEQALNASPSPEPTPAEKPVGVKPSIPAKQPDDSGRPPAVKAPMKKPETVAAQEAEGPASPGTEPATGGSDDASRSPATAPVQPQQLRVATLTPAIKLDIVRAVRRRIADQSGWLPGIVEEKSAYAAKVSGGELTLVNADSPEATRFSLFGAFVLELSLRRVVATAPGRRKLLDEEIPDAIRDVRWGAMAEEEHEKAEENLTDTELLAATHAQCLAALDVLEERYSQRMEQMRMEKTARKLGNVRLADLVKKLEEKARVAPEDVATALFHELTDVRRRLDRLEGRLSQNK